MPKNIDADKLKACPFCGSTEVTIEDNSLPGAEDWYIECAGCGTEFQASIYGIPCAKAELIGKWNRRADAERKSGEWIEDDYGWVQCSECG